MFQQLNDTIRMIKMINSYEETALRLLVRLYESNFFVSSYIILHDSSTYIRNNFVDIILMLLLHLDV